MASSSTSRPAPPLPPKSPESFESLNRRNSAAEILQSYEKLSWYSFLRCESLAQTRLHFQNVIAGLTEEDEAALVNWKEDRSPRPAIEGEGRSSAKGKERVSAGGDGVAGSSARKVGKTQASGGGGGSAKKKRRSGARS